jgi:hypothetical protein
MKIEELMLDTLVQQLGKELEMEEFITSPEIGHYIASFNDNIQVEMSQSDKSYQLKALIGKLPEKNVDSFLKKTMEANLFGRGTRGAVIGLDAEGNLLTLSLELDYNSSYKDFKDKLEDFVNVLDFWRQETLKQQ